MEMKIDKSNWKTVKLIDVFTKKEENDKENAKNRFDRFLKVNHMDAESLNIKRWSSQESGDELNPYFYKIFRKGQILFPTRNPHLRRAVLASFDGITGEKTLTLEPKEQYLVPDFIPFLFHSESFYAHTTGAIIGSTNPHCRWRDVANYEFLLPPKDQQAKLAKLLWAMDEVVEREKEVLEKLRINLEVKSSELIWKNGHSIENLISYADSNIGKLIDGDWIESKDQSEEGIRLIQLADIGVRKFINKSRRYINEETFQRLRCFEVLPDDVLIARMPDPIGRACIIEDVGERMITAVDCCIARVDKSHSYNRFLLHLLNTREFLYKANLLASGTTRQRIARKVLEEIKVPKPELNEQESIANKLDNLYNVMLQLELKIQSSNALQKSLINKVF
tara:strand:+ start:11063 stop:12241 length:1179 start_codon:yes stop_codon:yes gene_type:complete